MTELDQLLAAIKDRNMSISEAIALINGQPKLPISPDDIKLSVDHTKTVEQSIATGKYDWKNDNIAA